MKYAFPATLFSLVLLITAIASADDSFWNRPPHPNGAYGYDESLPDLLNIKGLTYHQARPIIIGAGWTPLQTLQKGTKEYEIDAMSGDGKIVWNKGYHELQSCTGGGPAYCVFVFQNKNGDKIRVVSKGEEWDDPSCSAEVLGYRFMPKD